MLDQLSCEATNWKRGQFVEFISSLAVKWCEIYMKFILHCGCRWKWRMIIAVNFFLHLFCTYCTVWSFHLPSLRGNWRFCCVLFSGRLQIQCFLSFSNIIPRTMRTRTWYHWCWLSMLFVLKLSPSSPQSRYVPSCIAAEWSNSKLSKYTRETHS